MNQVFIYKRVRLNNKVSEGIYRMLVARGLKPVRHGLTLIVSMSMGLLLYIKKRKPEALSSNINGMISFSLGNEEKPGISYLVITY